MTKQNEELSRLPLTSDYVFKRVFAKEGNEDILKDFLEAILDISIKKVEVKNPELPKNIADEKLGILDLKVHIDDKIVVDVEIQMKNEHDIEHRSTRYMTKLSSDQLKTKEPYPELKKVIVVNFVYYKRNSYHLIAHMKFEETKEKEYIDLGYEKEDEIVTDDLEMHFIELPKFKKKNPGVATKLEQWLWMLIGEEEKVKMAEKENKEIEKVVEELDEISLDEKERELYEARQRAIFEYNYTMYTAEKRGKEIGIQEGKEEGRKEGIKEGIKEGEKNNARKIAKKLLELGMKIEEIIEVTGLTKEEIENL